MIDQQFNRREFNVSASAAVAVTTTSPLTGAYLNRASLSDLMASPAADIISHLTSEAAIERMCRKIVLNDCADSLVRHPDRLPAAYWQQLVQTFEEMGGVPGSFPELLRYAVNKPGSFAHDSLVSASHEARRCATEKIDEFSQLPFQKNDPGQVFRTMENAFGRRLDLMYRLHERAPDSFRAPIVEASLWSENLNE